MTKDNHISVGGYDQCLHAADGGIPLTVKCDPNDANQSEQPLLGTPIIADL